MTSVPEQLMRDPQALQAMLENAERLAQLGSWEMRPDEDILIWSDNLYRIYGFEPGAVVPSIEMAIGLAHPDDRERLAREIELIVSTDRPRPPLEYRIVRSDGVRHLRASTALVDPTPGARRLVGAIEDRTDSHHSEREIAAHVAVSRALDRWESLELGGARLLRSIGEAMGFDRGAFWVPFGDLLEARLFWYATESAQYDERSETTPIRLPQGVGLAGEAWEKQAPVTIADIDSNTSYAFRDQAIRVEVHGAIAFPAIHEGAVLAVLGFGARENIQLTERLMDCLVSFGAEIGRFLSRRRGELKPALLSRRELEVLQIAADGRQGPAIAEQLGISASTVRTHFENIYAKLGVADRGSAVATALRDGLID